MLLLDRNMTGCLKEGQGQRDGEVGARHTHTHTHWSRTRLLARLLNHSHIALSFETPTVELHRARRAKEAGAEHCVLWGERRGLWLVFLLAMSSDWSYLERVMVGQGVSTHLYIHLFHNRVEGVFWCAFVQKCCSLRGRILELCVCGGDGGCQQCAHHFAYVASAIQPLHFKWSKCMAV